MEKAIFEEHLKSPAIAFRSNSGDSLFITEPEFSLGILVIKKYMLIILIIYIEKNQNL